MRSISRIVRSTLSWIALAQVALFALPHALAQEEFPIAPDAPTHFAAYSIDWSRFDRLVSIAKETAPADRLSDVARSLRSNVPPEAGRLTPLDLFCLANAWIAYHSPPNSGKPILRDPGGMEGEELYLLLRKGYRISSEQAVRIDAPHCSPTQSPCRFPARSGCKHSPRRWRPHWLPPPAHPSPQTNRHPKPSPVAGRSPPIQR